MRTISDRELRKNTAGILRRVEAGETVRITVRGRAVAMLTPATAMRCTFVNREEVLQLLARAPLDRKVSADVRGVVAATIEEL